MHGAAARRVAYRMYAVKLRFSWILVVALLASMGLLLLPATEPTSEGQPERIAIEEELPELTILEARVRAFGKDGAATWTLQSPRIDYHMDGSLDFTLPRVLLQNSSGARLQAEAGRGWLAPTPEEEKMNLYSKVDALLFNSERVVAFSTEALSIAESGRFVSAPQSVRIRSSSADTNAANLELHLDEQILLLGSTADEAVHTRIQPAGALQ